MAQRPSLRVTDWPSGTASGHASGAPPGRSRRPTRAPGTVARVKIDDLTLWTVNVPYFRPFT
jgi:hypothetical protein